MGNLSKKLSIFIPSLYGGGAERTILKLAGGIASRGYKVDLVLARAEGPYLADVPKTVNLVNLNAARDLHSLLPLVHYLKRERPDALLSGLHTNIIAIWARYLSRIPMRLVVSERNMLSPKINYFTSDLRMRFMPLLVRSFYPWADYIVAVSKEVADDIINIARISSNRILVIYNPIVTPEFQDQARVPLEHPWFQSGDPPVILAVGRLTGQKDHATLIKAFARIRETKQARLLILGEGEERAHLEKLIEQLRISPDVSLPGFISNPYPYMTKAKAFVLPSRWEGLPGALIEAMYCGTQLIATDCSGGTKEILANGKFGRLVPVGDIEAMANAINDALENKILPPPQDGWKPFEQEIVVNQYIEVLFGMS